MTRGEVLAFLETLPAEMALPDIMRRLRAAQPALRPPSSRPIAVPTPEETRELIAAPGEGHKHSAMLRTLYATGMRSGELVAVRFVDLRPASQSIFVRDGKGDWDRYVLADAQTLAALALLRGKKPADALIFPVHARHLWLVVHKWATAIGLKPKYEALGFRMGPHSLRHSFATHCYQNGMSLELLRQLLGHDSLYHTWRYVHGSWPVWQAGYTQSHPLARGGPRVLHTPAP